MNDDLISRQDAIDAVMITPQKWDGMYIQDLNCRLRDTLNALPSAQLEEVIPHRNYKYLSDYWCECGWHLGKKGEVKYCSECGRKVNWNE